jgi:hypothetical protein
MHAVLTGDIVGSSALTPEEHRKVVGIVKSVASAFPEIVVGAVDVFSGDSWQMLLNDCGESFKIALYLRASLKRQKAFSIDSRISVVWGDVDLNQVNPSRISESTGETFTASGRGLARLKKPALMCFSALTDPRLSLAVDGMVRLMDALVRQWSPEQARAIAETLLGKTQQEIAEEFDVGQSSINKSLQAALWPDVDYAIGQLGELVKNHPFG